MAFLAVPYFSTFHKVTNFGRKLLNLKCVFCLYNFCLEHFSFYEEFSEILS